jgi:hypothetical protein
VPDSSTQQVMCSMINMKLCDFSRQSGFSEITVVQNLLCICTRAGPKADFNKSPGTKIIYMKACISFSSPPALRHRSHFFFFIPTGLFPRFLGFSLPFPLSGVSGSLTLFMYLLCHRLFVSLSKAMLDATAGPVVGIGSQ